MKVEVQITPIVGEHDVPPIRIAIMSGRHKHAVVELTAADFALAITGRLVHGELKSKASDAMYELQIDGNPKGL